MQQFFRYSVQNGFIFHNFLSQRNFNFRILTKIAPGLCYGPLVSRQSTTDKWARVSPLKKLEGKIQLKSKQDLGLSQEKWAENTTKYSIETVCK